jgi:translation initiation factor 4E
MAAQVISDTSPDLAHPLSNKWTLWNHLPHETDWSINGYKVVDTVNTVEQTVGLCKAIPPVLPQTSMLYFMKNNIKPIWEDVNNRRGGCFSYQIPSNVVADVWTRLCFALTGNTLSDNSQCMATINGITVSPKKKFCIIKIWMSGCNYQDPNVIINSIPGLTSHGCLFKKFDPEY